MLIRALNIAFGRVARNVYLWAAIILIRLSNFDFHYTLPESVYLVLLLIPVLVLLYTNNLVLVPRLLIRRKYVQYLASAGALLAAAVYASLAIIRYQVVHSPGISVYKTIWIATAAEAVSEPPVLAAIHVFLFTIYVLIFTLFWYANDYRSKQREVEAIRQRQLETELSFLKDQLNPHFLFNTLNNLYGLALRQSASAPEAILQLSRILRYLLYESNTATVSFGREKEIMQAYIELELLRLSDVDDVVFSIHADGTYAVPPLLWLPVLENTFKHGRHDGGGGIEFSCTIRANELHIHSRNHCEPGQPDAGENGSSGIGMGNLRKRLQLLYPGRHTLATGIEQQSYIVDLKIKLA